jgi:hypothetical protein
MTALLTTDDRIPRLLVTGHPNHELAILGFVQRMRPHLLFLTDGGAEARSSESRELLGSLGLGAHARFLGVSEAVLYQALVDGDTATFQELAAEVRREIERTGARQVLCESVEFYNPLHDLTLPLVRAATRGMEGVEVLEFPLIAERVDAPGAFRLQRPVTSRSADVLSLQLTKTEVHRKLRAARRSYPSLRAQMGAILDAVEASQAALECFLPASRVPEPGPEHVLRYEARGRLLAKEGLVEHIITWRDHFLPAVASLEN